MLATTTTTRATTSSSASRPPPSSAVVAAAVASAVVRVKTAAAPNQISPESIREVGGVGKEEEEEGKSQAFFFVNVCVMLAKSVHLIDNQIIK